MGLHNASESVRINDSRGCEDYPGELVPLEEFDYHNDKMGCVLRRSMGNVDFAGITVSIYAYTSSQSVNVFRVTSHSTSMEVGLITTTMYYINIE